MVGSTLACALGTLRVLGRVGVRSVQILLKIPHADGGEKCS